MSIVEIGGIYPVESNIIQLDKKVVIPNRQNRPKLTILSGIKHTPDMEDEIAIALVKTGEIRIESIPPKVIEGNWSVWKKVFTTV